MIVFSLISFLKIFFVYLKRNIKYCFRERTFQLLIIWTMLTQNKVLLFTGIWTGKDDKSIEKKHACTKWKMKIWSFFVTCKKYTKIRITANIVQQRLLYGVTLLHKIRKESLCCLSFNYTRISWSRGKDCQNYLANRKYLCGIVSLHLTFKSFDSFH